MSAFPSLEEFDAGQTTAQPVLGNDDNDFLAREQALLGDDAAFFNGGDQPQQQASSGEADFLGGGEDEIGQFESSFPALDNPAIQAGGVISVSSEPYMPGTAEPFTAQTPAAAPNFQNDDESEPIRQWRERQALQIQKRDEQSEQKKQETIERARRAIDDFYENYNTKKDKAIEETRIEEKGFLESRDNAVAGGTTWERIAKLVDLSDKRGDKDLSRFRGMLINLRKDENAPGAAGY
ncbi:Clathrin light chain [Saitoella coloradoensis]